MSEHHPLIVPDHLPFFITAPAESDLLFGAVSLTLVGVLVAFGALYFTIQAIPDRLVEGTSKAQMQLVGILGLISLFTMNNAFWIAALLLAALRIPDFWTPLAQIAASMRDKDTAAEASPEPLDETATTVENTAGEHRDD